MNEQLKDFNHQITRFDIRVDSWKDVKTKDKFGYIIWPFAIDFRKDWCEYYLNHLPTGLYVTSHSSIFCLIDLVNVLNREFDLEFLETIMPENANVKLIKELVKSHDWLDEGE